MNRIECEKKMAVLMQQIVDVYLEYNPNGKSLCLNYIYCENGNGNDEGDWDVRRIYGQNLDDDNKINFEASIDVNDEKYQLATENWTEEEKKDNPVEWRFYSGRW